MKQIGLLAALLLTVVRGFSCTGLLLEAKDGTTVNGRTLEFGVDLDMGVAFVPRNFSFVGETPLGKGMKYRSKYAAVGIYCFDEPILTDGINEHGLVAASFYFPGYASYPKTTRQNLDKALSPIDFTNWILTQFATLDEVKEAVKGVVIAPTVFKEMGNQPVPLHFIVYDKNGKSIVIEPIDGTLKVHENPLGVITNAPTFDWHLTNLSNYINLSPENVTTSALRNFKLHAFGQGTGMLGLPGDFTPPSRFVRAAFFSATALPMNNSAEAVLSSFHLLNQFDIPLGSVRGKDGGKPSYDYTMWTCVKNPQTLELFYRTFKNQAIEYVNLHHFDWNAKKMKTMKVSGSQELHNVSTQL